MPRFTSKDGSVVIETSLPTEAAELRSQGFTESKARTAATKAADAEAPNPAESAKSGEAPKSTK